MYDFRPADGTPKPELYRDLLSAADALTAGETDGVANMANVAALLWEFLPDVNWTGFYRTDPNSEDGELVLGPFAGRPACIRIPRGKGVCGAAAARGGTRAPARMAPGRRAPRAARGETQLVPDVHAFPGHIACDSETASELVVPVLRDGDVIAVIDLDSPRAARFDEEDRDGIEALARMLAARI